MKRGKKRCRAAAREEAIQRSLEAMALAKGAKGVGRRVWAFTPEGAFALPEGQGERTLVASLRQRLKAAGRGK